MRQRNRVWVVIKIAGGWIMINFNKLNTLITSNDSTCIESALKIIKDSQGTGVNRLIKYFTRMMLSGGDSSLPNWFELSRQANLISGYEKHNFSDLILVELLSRLIEEPSLITSERYHDVFVELIKTCEDKLNVIKLFTAIDIGEELVINLMQDLIDKNALTNNELRKFDTFFLDTYNKKLFELTHKEIEKFPEEMVVSSDVSSRIRLLKTIPDDMANKIKNIMRQLECGRGNVSSDENTAAKFILASIKEDKINDYDYHPTLLKLDELKEYFECFLKLPAPAQEKFIIMGAHWAAGEIEIQANGEIKILLSDSHGDPVDCGDFYFQDTLKQIVSAEHFKNNDIKIYYPVEKRQNSAKGCSIFALDDVRHFHTMERFMNGESLFSYFEQHEAGKNRHPLETQYPAGKPITLAADKVLIPCHLPPQLLTTMQSSRAVSLINEHGNVVNKKGNTSLDLLKKSVVFNQRDQKNQYKRIDYKLDRMIERLQRKWLGILQSDNPNGRFNDFLESANEHTLAGFITRVESLRDKTLASSGISPEISALPCNSSVKPASQEEHGSGRPGTPPPKKNIDGFNFILQLLSNNIVMRLWILNVGQGRLLNNNIALFKKTVKELNLSKKTDTTNLADAIKNGLYERIESYLKKHEYEMDPLHTPKKHLIQAIKRHLDDPEDCPWNRVLLLAEPNKPWDMGLVSEVRAIFNQAKQFNEIKAQEQGKDRIHYDSSARL